MSNSSECKCDRCGKQEYIPTFQYVKFEERTRYFCKECYEELRSFVVRRSSVRVSKFIPIG